MRTLAVWAGSSGALDEDGFAEVELPREGLHLRDAEVIGAFDDGQRIAGEGAWW